MAADYIIPVSRPPAPPDPLLRMFPCRPKGSWPSGPAASMLRLTSVVPNDARPDLEHLVLTSEASETRILRDYQVVVRDSPADRWIPVYRFGQVLLEPGQSIRLFTSGRVKEPDLSMRRPQSVLGGLVAVLDPKGKVVADASIILA